MPDLEVKVYAGADVPEGGLFSRVELGLRGLVSGTPETAPVSSDVAVPDDGAPAGGS